MGVFKWLRRERVTVTTHHNVTSDPAVHDEPFIQSTTQVGTIRTEEYKRALAEFQARRSTDHRELQDLQETPVKAKKCGRHSLPVSCTACASDHDNTFNYEKKSASKYKKHKRARSNTPEKIYDGLPNIQFLFQNQVFMPGNSYPASHSEPCKVRRQSRRVSRSPDFVVQRQIEFKDDQADSPPEFFKNNSLPFDVNNFMEGNRSQEEVDGIKAAGDVKSSPEGSDKDLGDDDRLWDVMNELRHFDQWADEQLTPRSPNTKSSDDSKSETSGFGLPLASARNLDMNVDLKKIWNNGRWGTIPVQIKKLSDVTIEHVKKKRITEINILRKCRHPNIILLMGLYPDVNNNVHIICERCVDSLFGVLHVQGRILTVQTSVQYVLDISNALVFLKMQGYIHTQVNSTSIMITNHDTAKLVDLGPCVKVNKVENCEANDKNYEIYSPEPQYVNIEDIRTPKTIEDQPLLSANPSETYLKSNAVAKPYEVYENSEMYRWQAPELFEASEDGMVYPCSKSDVYSLCLVLWECCNALLPFKMLSYNKLKEQYTLWKTGLSLPKDGTYPGSLLSLLQTGLSLQRGERIDMDTLQRTLQTVKHDIDELDYIIIPARIQTKKSTFSSTAWDTTSPTDSDCQSPKHIQHEAVIHTNNNDSSTESEKERSDSTPLYETIKKTYSTATYSQKCFIPDGTDCAVPKYELLQEKDYSSACSTPIAKLRARIKDIETPGTLHRSDSTEYCSILSPNRTNLGFNDTSNKVESVERPTAKLSRSFTPKSYKPLHIKVPELDKLDSIKPLLKERNGLERSSYNFDINNYSLPTTPIARSNKLRRNAWLSGDYGMTNKNNDSPKSLPNEPTNVIEINNKSSPEYSPTKSVECSPLTSYISETSPYHAKSIENTPENVGNKDNVTGLRKVEPPQDFLTPDTDEPRERAWSFKSSLDRSPKYKVDEDALANMSVKPLVAIHERWIYEANRKSGRSMSLPEDNSVRCQIPAVKPASHCVDTLQKSLPQLNAKKSPKSFRTSPSPNSGKNGGNWEQYCQARESIAKGLNFTGRDPDRFHTRKKDTNKGTSTETKAESKIDQATDTKSIEEFIRDLIRKEFQHLIQEIAGNPPSQHEELLNKGVANVMESLHTENHERPNRDFSHSEDLEQTLKKDLSHTEDNERTLRKDNQPLKSFSRVKINGNNKPLLQITFNRSGENSLHVLDNCVNVTICDGSSSRDKLNSSMEDGLVEDGQFNALKRCQAFNAIQEARSTEDLYIDDDLSTQMQENFGGRVKLIPLHGSLHEILCEKEDDCCLIKVKQENGCDTIYFRCDNSDTESRDAIDGCDHQQETVVFKRSISLIEERIQRVLPKEKHRGQPSVTQRKHNKDIKVRPKSEIFAPINRETRVLSNSSPSIPTMMDKEEVELNIENVMCYQDSSSEECLKCQDWDDFEVLEKKIEEDIASNVKLGCGCLEKISEENLAGFNDEAGEKV